jgi:hypothetical protein
MPPAVSGTRFYRPDEREREPAARHEAIRKARGLDG